MINRNNIIEVCVANIQSAMAAHEGGASRIELCDNLYEGGTTPGYGTIKYAKEILDIGIHVMIRPRGSDFCYSDMEYEIMKKDIQLCLELGVDGVVFGILLPNGHVDKNRTKKLVEVAGSLHSTFHRAFDMTPDPYKSLEDLIDCGIGRILTAGQKNTVPEGKELIRDLVSEAGNRISIMPGSGINEKNIQSLRDYTGATDFHMTGRKPVESEMNFRKSDIYMGGLPQIPEYSIQVTDADRIRKIVNLVNETFIS